MNNSISINEKQLPIKEYNGRRVITLKDIDAVHGKADGTARKRFNNNKKHFVEGIDYIKVLMSEKRTLGFDVPNRGLIMLTESGYLMLAKSFSDDLAWKVQRGLVNNYFRAKDPETEQMTLEALENKYHYYPKTYNGKPVISVSDFVNFTGVNYYTACGCAKTRCKLNVDYYTPMGLDLQRYKRENPSVNIRASRVILLNESGARKLLKHFGLSGNNMPLLEQKKALPQEQDTKPAIKQTDKTTITTQAETAADKQITSDDCITALNVLRQMKRNCEINLETAKSEGKNESLYKKELDECNNVIKGVGMMLAMGY